MLLVGGCCLASAVGMVLLVPEAEVQRMLEDQNSQVPPEHREQLPFSLSMPVLAGIMSACGLLSGIVPVGALCGLAF